MINRTNKVNIKDLILKELEEALVRSGERSYRAKQVFTWVHKKGVNDFDKMKNLPGTLLAKLDERFFISRLECKEHLRSEDNAEKFIFKLDDGYFIESVLISDKERKTICISSQVGCKFGCAFCASGRMGFIRDLTPSEIVGQVFHAKYECKKDLTNFVFMGMGEPLDNANNVLRSITIMNSPDSMGIGSRRITISTAGVIPGIKRLSKPGNQINLSVSLHAANEKLRNELMPINKKYPLKKLIEACRNYVEITGRILTLEYVLIKDKNDTLKDADELAGIAKELKAKINLIRMSPVPEANFAPTDQITAEVFKKRILNKNITVTLRRSKGGDISASCGQLAGMKSLT